MKGFFSEDWASFSRIRLCSPLESPYKLATWQLHGTIKGRFLWSRESLKIGDLGIICLVGEVATVCEHSETYTSSVAINWAVLRPSAVRHNGVSETEEEEIRKGGEWVKNRNSSRRRIPLSSRGCWERLGSRWRDRAAEEAGRLQNLSRLWCVREVSTNKRSVS